MKKTKLAIIFTSLILVMSIAGSLLFINNMNGSIRLFKTAITINFKDNVYTYNDEELESLNYTISDGNLFSGDKLKFTFKSEIKNAGIYNRDYFEYSIISQTGKDVTSSYIINENFEDIVINKRPITIKTASAVGTYRQYVEGSVSFKSFEIYEGSLCEGHFISASGFRKSFYVGTFDNTCSVVIKNSSNSTVTKNYDISFYNGTLFVLPTSNGDSGNIPTPSPEPDPSPTPSPNPEPDKDDDSSDDVPPNPDKDDENEDDQYNYVEREDENADSDKDDDSSDSDDSGDGDGPINQITEEEDQPLKYSSKEEVLENLYQHQFYYYMHTSGNHFLRTSANTGTYDKNRFLKVQAYKNKYGLNPDEFVTYLLKDNVNHHKGTMDYSEFKSRDFDIHLNYPLYNKEQDNDLYPILSDLECDSLDLEGLNYDYMLNPTLLDEIEITDSTFIKAEADYRKFVYENYLGMDGEDSIFLKDFIQENNLNGNNIYEISKNLINMFSSEYKYQMWELECANSDYINIAFLKETKIGKCYNFATASTLIFRALGYPARMIQGFSVSGDVGMVDVLGINGHAKTQVYYDGRGWIDLEFTCGTPTEDTPQVPWGDDEDDSEDEKVQLTISSESATKTYDGKPLSNSLFTIEGEDKLKEGHKIFAFCNNFIVNAGSIENVVTYFILDSNFKDVSNEYNILTNFGTLTVDKKDAEFSTNDIVVEFDDQLNGRYISCLSDTLIESDCITNLETLKFAERGKYSNIIFITKICNKYGEDVTNNYNITYNYGTLEVI